MHHVTMIGCYQWRLFEWSLLHSRRERDIDMPDILRAQIVCYPFSLTFLPLSSCAAWRIIYSRFARTGDRSSIKSRRQFHFVLPIHTSALLYATSIFYPFSRLRSSSSIFIGRIDYAFPISPHITHNRKRTKIKNTRKKKRCALSELAESIPKDTPNAPPPGSTTGIPCHQAAANPFTPADAT